MKVILVYNGYTPKSIAMLKSNRQLKVIVYQNQKEFDQYISDSTIVLIRSNTQVHEKLILGAKNLKLVVTATSGFDHIDYSCCMKNNIKVLYTPNANVQSAAELTIGHMLNISRKLTQAQTSLFNDRWRSPDLFASNLGGKNLGIVGLGRIGQKVTQIAQAIGMKVAAYDPYIEHSMFQALNVEPQGFMELLRNSDVLSLHVPLTKETFEMINAKTLVEANTDLILINASRGQVIREPDLIQWLQKKKIKAAGLDVYHKEPLVKDSELKQLKNVFLTPHIGAFTEEAYVEASEDAVAKALRFIDSGELRDELPLDQAWAKFL